MDQANGCHHRDAFEAGKGAQPPAEDCKAGATELAAPDAPPAAPVPQDPPPDVRSGDRSQQRQQTLLDWLGHELRNPIAAIELAVHAMRQLGDERLDDPLSILERQSGQLGRVVLELLEMARAISQPPGVGVPTRYLPRDDEQDRSPPRNETARGSSPGQSLRPPRHASGTGRLRQRLLLVEDNEDLSDLLVELLTGWGFEVVAAASANSALAKAAVRPPDVALIDIGLPDRDGCEVARALRSSLPRTVRLIAMSGYGQRQDGARALGAGFDEFLVKPLNTARLRRLLGEISSLSLAMAGRET